MTAYHITDKLLIRPDRPPKNKMGTYPISKASNCCSSEGFLYDIISLGCPTLKRCDRPIVIFLQSLVSGRTISKGACIHCFCWFTHRLPFSNRPFAIADAIDVVSLRLLNGKTWTSFRHSRLKVFWFPVLGQSVVIGILAVLDIILETPC